MPEKFSITSTGKPGEFLGGASLIDFIRLWNPSSSVEANISSQGTGWTLVNWQQSSPGARFAHSVLLRTSADAPRYDRAVVLRTVGHFLLSTMPAEGLTEALEGLAETYSFWLGDLNRSALSSQPTSSFYEATQAPSRERPAFRVIQE